MGRHDKTSRAEEAFLHKVNAANQKDIVRHAVKANEEGMTYGQYVAMKWAQEHPFVRNKDLVKAK